MQKLSKLNQDFGGSSFFSGPVKHAQDGGQIAVSQQAGNFNDLVNAIADLNIFVQVEDITSAQGLQTEVIENTQI